MAAVTAINMATLEALCSRVQSTPRRNSWTDLHNLVACRGIIDLINIAIAVRIRRVFGSLLVVELRTGAVELMLFRGVKFSCKVGEPANLG